MTLRVVHSDRSELLLEVLAERVHAHADPFSPFLIATPSRLVERHVELFLAERLGIAAALTMKRLSTLLEERLEAASGRRMLSVSRLEALLRTTLLTPPRLDGAALAAVRDYLGDRTPLRLFERRACELAARMARILGSYARDRPDLFRAWLAGDMPGDRSQGVDEISRSLAEWQRALLDAALRDTRDRFVSIADGPRLLAGEPMGPPLVVFGYSFLSPAELASVLGLAAATEVLVLSPNPCAEFWEDATRKAAAGEPMESVLLARWGTAAREHVAALDAASGFSSEQLYVADDEATLLGRIQASIRRRTPVREGVAGLGDASITLVAAPSVRREVESVAEEIWALVHAGARTAAPLRFPDIAVWVPARDRDLYLPHLETVFAEANGVPWSAIDLSLASRSRAVEALLRLFALLVSGPTRTALLDVVLHPLVLARLGAAGDASAIADRLDRLGFFFGADATEVPAAYRGDVSAIHLDQAVTRLALGAAMLGERSGDARLVEIGGARYLPEELDAGEETDRALLALLRSLGADVHFAREARLPLTGWSTFFAALASAYLAPDEQESEELRRALATVAELPATGLELAAGGLEAPTLALSTACALATSALESLPAVGGASGRGVLVGKLAPMRALSRRVVFVLGLGEGRFPTREPETGLDLRALDLRAGRRRSGELSAEDRDRHALLEALGSARDRLVLSYVARDEQTGDVIAPCHALAELVEVAPGIPVERPPLRRHEAAVSAALGPSSEAARVRAAAIPAAASEARARMLGASERARFARSATPLHDLATTMASDDRGRVLLGMPSLAAPESSVRGTARAASSRQGPVRVSLAELRRFLDCPVQGSASRLLGHDDDDGARFAESEPFETEERVHEALVRALVVLRLELRAAAGGAAAGGAAAVDTLAAGLTAHGRFPLGAYGERARRAADDDASRVLAQLARRRPGAHSAEITRFGATREHTREAARALDSIVLAPDGGASRIELVGATAPLLDGREPLRFDLGSEKDAEERALFDLRLALHAFLDHCALACAAPAGAPALARRALLLGRDRSEDLLLAPVRPELAKRWLLGLARELALESHAYFLPIEAVLRLGHVFTTGSGALEEQLEASIELVRTKWEGGRSRFGPVREATRFAAPEGAARLVGQRYGIFFAHLRSPTLEAPRVRGRR